MNRFVNSITTLSVVTRARRAVRRVRSAEKREPSLPLGRRTDPGRQHIRSETPRTRARLQVQGEPAADQAGDRKLAHQRRASDHLHLRDSGRQRLRDEGLRAERRGAWRGWPHQCAGRALELGRSYYWRARAEDGANNSLFSSAEFSVLPRAVLTVPTPALAGERRDGRRRAGRRCSSTTRPGTKRSVPSPTTSMSPWTRRSRSSSGDGLVDEGAPTQVTRQSRSRLFHDALLARPYASDGEPTTALVADRRVHDPGRDQVVVAAEGRRRWRWRWRHHERMRERSPGGSRDVVLPPSAAPRDRMPPTGTRSWSARAFPMVSAPGRSRHRTRRTTASRSRRAPAVRAAGCSCRRRRLTTSATSHGPWISSRTPAADG